MEHLLLCLSLRGQKVSSIPNFTEEEKREMFRRRQKKLKKEQARLMAKDNYSYFEDTFLNGPKKADPTE